MRRARISARRRVSGAVALVSVAACGFAACGGEPAAAPLDLLADPSALEISVPAGTGAPEILKLRESVAWDFADPEQGRWRLRTMRGRTRGGPAERGGEPCFLIAAGGAGADADVRTLVRVAPSTDYRLEAALWTADLEPLDARVSGTLYLGELDYLRADGEDWNDPLRWHTSGPRFTATPAGWHHFTYRFRTEPATRMLRLAASLGNWGRARGELCLGEVRLVESAAAGEATRGLRALSAVVGNEIRRALPATPASEVRFALRVPENGALAFGAGLDEGGRRLGGDGVLFEVDVEDAGRTVNLYSQQIRRDAGAWEDVRVPLDAFAGRRVTLVLHTLPSRRGAVPDFAGDLAFWANPRIETAAGRRTAGRRAQPDVFLITVDTLRPDHLGCYGYGRATSPAIDALAADGVLFENAFTTVPRTGPAVASLLTGRYPAAHGVTSMLDPLGGANVTLAEVLRAAGYRTAAQVTLNLPWRKSFDQGFERYDDRYDDPVARGDGLGLRAADWVERHRGKRHRGPPMFYWLHLWDPHFVYAAPEPWERFFDPAFDGVFDLYDRVRRKERTWGQVFFDNDLTPRQVEHAVARYDGEIRYSDRVLERFLDRLKALELYDDAVIVFTSDHGESLGEHGYHFEHGEYLYDATLRIPLIVKLPRGRAAGRRVAAAASILDVAPTVLAAAGAGDPTALDGQDLSAHLDGSWTRRPVLFAQSGQSFFPENPRREVAGLAGYWTGIREGRFKLVRIPRRGGDDYELYDLEADPAETENLYRSGDPRTERLIRSLDAWRSRLLESRGGEPAPAPGRPELERLRALGYVN